MENIKYIKPSSKGHPSRNGLSASSLAKERSEKKILNQSLSQLMLLNDHFKAKKEHRQNIRNENEAKRLKNQNLYHHEYERIKNYLDTSVVDPVEVGRLESRKKGILAMGERKKTKYDELLNGK